MRAPFIIIVVNKIWNKSLIFFFLTLITLLFACKNEKTTLDKNYDESICIDKIDEYATSTENASQEKDDSWFGDFRVINFGKYEQDGNVKNGKEDIKWLIIEDTGSERLMISKDVLYAMPFDDKVDLDENSFNQNWEKSSLRKWLNEDFFDTAFDEEEKKYVIANVVKNGLVFGVNNNYEPVDIGFDTVDKVYILSKDEIRNYLGFEEDGACENYLAKPSAYAKNILDEEKQKEDIAVWHKEKEYDAIDDNYAEYWVRSSLGMTTMSDIEFYTDIVDKKGHLSNLGFPYYVSKNDKSDNIKKERYYNRGVRPVIRILGTSLFEKDLFDAVRPEKKAQVYDIKRINETYEIANYEKNKTYKDFDTVVLGSYEQDGDTANGQEGIEWIVLKKEDGKAFLLSKYILDYVEYSNVLERYVVWKDSRLRAWANHEFYDNSFNEQEKVLISSSKTKNYDNPVYGNSSGSTTIDKIFVPSFDELLDGSDIKYFDCMREPYYDYKKIDDSRIATIFTDYALKKYRKEKNNNKAEPTPEFWLRNQGRSGEEINSSSNNAMTANNTIDLKGTPYYLFQYNNDSYKTISSNPKLGFRPCMWIDISVLDEFDGKSYDEKVDKIFSEEVTESIKYDFSNIDEAKIVTAYNVKATIANYDVVTLGSYEQDGNMDNGKEDIEWIVLDKKGDEYLLLSKYVLDYCQFKNVKVEGETISWVNSDIRMWANTEFINSAFSETEEKNIMLSSIDNTNNDYYKLRLSEDRIFLLSIDEIEKYFGSKNDAYDGNKVENLIVANDKSRSFATEFARKRGVIAGSKGHIINNDNVYSCGYYTRSMRNTNNNQVLYIGDNGSDNWTSVYDTWKRYGFRPAIWVKK